MTSPELDARWPDVAAMLRQRTEELGELFVGMANGPYLLLLRARDPARVVELLERRPVQDVEIHWSSQVQDGTRWTVSSAYDAEPFELSFTLPDPVAQWIFDPEADARRRAIAFKEAFLSTITIYRYVNGQDRLYRLRFSRPQVAESWPRRPR